MWDEHLLAFLPIEFWLHVVHFHLVNLPVIFKVFVFFNFFTYNTIICIGALNSGAELSIA